MIDSANRVPKLSKRPVPVCSCPRDPVTDGWMYDEHSKAITDPYCPIHGERARKEFEKAVSKHENATG